MVLVPKRYFVFITLFMLIVSFTTVRSYSNLNGIELGDRVEISFTRYIDGDWSYEYTDEEPFEVVVSYAEINENVVNGLLGMKKGEIKDIEWDVEQENGTINHFEYRDTKIIQITYDSTPSGSGIGNIVLIIFEVLLGIGVVVAIIYVFVKIRKRFKIKPCSICSNTATSKCAKCGTFICSECSSKGCSECGSRKFIIL